MVRLFNIAIFYHGKYLWAKVVEHHHSPSTFHITFRDHSEVDVPAVIILDTKNSKLVPGGDSQQTKAEVLTLVILEIEEHFKHNYLSLR